MDKVLAEALRLRAAGLAVHWLVPSTKQPVARDWANLPVASAEDLAGTYRPGMNVGFRPGVWSQHGGDNIVVLDIDVRGGERFAEEAHAAAFSLTGSKGFTVKSGSGHGRHVFYRCPGSVAPAAAAITLRQSDVALPDGRPAWQIELLSTGKNVVLPPSLHPDTNKPYEWLETGDYRSIPDSVLERLEELTAGGAWRTPEPITTNLAGVLPIKAAMLPKSLRRWLVDTASRMQCPIDYVAAPSLVVASILIGARCAVRPKRRDNWTVIPNLWGGIVGSPGMMKSPALKAVLQPIEDLEKRAKGAFHNSRSTHTADEIVRKAARRAIEAQLEKHLKAKGYVSGPDPVRNKLHTDLAALVDPPEPTWKRYKTNDTTVEKIVELEAANPGGLLLFRDELAGFLVSLDREDRPGDRAFYLEAWSGDQSYTTDRIGRGTVHAENNCLAILGGIQPSRLEGYLYEARALHANDGLLQRFQLLVYPDEPRRWRSVDRRPNRRAVDRAVALLVKLADTDFSALGAQFDTYVPVPPQPGATQAPAQVGIGRPFFRFDDAAQTYFNAWQADLEQRIRSGDGLLMTQHLAKYRSLMPSIALIIHLIELLDTGKQGPITLAAAQQAAAWCKYLESHARRAYGIVAGQAQQAARMLAAKIGAGMLEDGFTERTVLRKGWGDLHDREQVALACRELQESNWIRRLPVQRNPKGGKPPLPGYEINPAVLPNAPAPGTDQTDKTL